MKPGTTSRPRKHDPQAAGLSRIKSPTKAARPNHQHGGRRVKFVVGDSVTANMQAPKDYVGRPGLITEIGPGKSEFRVEFEDSRQPTTGYLVSSWLDRV